MIGIPLLFVGLAAPGLEQLAAAALAEGVRSASGAISLRAGEVDVLLDGVSLGSVRLDTPELQLAAETLRVHATSDGLHVTLSGLDGEVTLGATSATQKTARDSTRRAREGQASTSSTSVTGEQSTGSSSAGSSSGASAASSPLAPKDALDRLRGRLRGVPIHVDARGELRVTRGARSARLVDPNLELSALGDVDLRGRLTLNDPALPSMTIETLHVHNESRLVAAGSWRDATWSLSGALGFAEPLRDDSNAQHAPGPEQHAPRLGLRAEIEGDSISAQLASHDGGQAALATRIPDGAAAWQVVGLLEAFPLATLQPWLARSSWASHVSTSDTTLTGTIELTHRGNDDISVVLRKLTVEGLVVDHPRIAREPLGFSAMTVNGELHRGATLTTQLEVAHRGAALALATSLGEDYVEVSAELATMPCQAVLEAMPEGMLPALQGTTLDGTFDAKLDFAVAPSALADFHPGFFDDPTPPGGKLDVRLPFFERCTLVREPTAVDAAALAGPYRHRFLSDGGRELERVLAPGGEGFFALATRPEVGLVFVALEDMRFFEHDGFDEQQIERAFWHNLSAGRIERGASTISQQTARNLWLGVDRSLSRKLQEALLTSRLEAAVDKRRILEVYVNVIELGPEVHGVAEAARFHFGLELVELNLLELVHLASMAPAPVAYAKRFASGEVDREWRIRLEEHVSRMARLGLVDEATASAARRAPLRLRARE